MVALAVLLQGWLGLEQELGKQRAGRDPGEEGCFRGDWGVGGGAWGLDPVTREVVGEESLGSAGLRQAYLQQEGGFPARPLVGRRHNPQGACGGRLTWDPPPGPLLPF